MPWTSRSFDALLVLTEPPYRMAMTPPPHSVRKAVRIGWISYGLASRPWSPMA